MKRGVLALVCLTSGCGGRNEPDVLVADAAAADAARPAIVCVGAAVPPTTLDCTGLYSAIETKQFAAGVREYAPAVPLWSDGAVKRRWISIPAGQKIDASDPSEWKFPVGTKVWKEFSWGGKRVETRLFQKDLPNHWVHAAYAWNADESAATISPGGDVPAPEGGTYHIPTRDECDECHRGRTDRLLGFEQVSLGLSGASGLTLEKLASEGLITPVPSRTTLEIGDDGTGLAVAPLGWLHINCGTTCHNGNPNSSAYGANMRLRLDPALLDGRSSAGFESLMTTVGAAVNAPAWIGRTRILPGDPDNSLLVDLISHRGSVNQMPPIATRIVDDDAVRSVVAWIKKMPSNGPPANPTGTDASIHVRDASVDASAPVPVERDARANEGGARRDARAPATDARIPVALDAARDGTTGGDAASHTPG